MLRFLDVSRWNGPDTVPWDEVDGGFARLTFGERVDPRGAEHLRRGHAARKLLGAYHWLDCSADARGDRQAQFFLEMVVKVAPELSEPLALAVDVEPADPRMPDPSWRVRVILRDFLKQITLAATCAVYLNLSEATRLDLGSAGRYALPDDLDVTPLWLADWTPPIVIPRPWERAALLQTGAQKGIDRDVFDGTADDFRRVFGLYP